jgi:hypothetical protein
VVRQRQRLQLLRSTITFGGIVATKVFKLEQAKFLINNYRILAFHVLKD